MHFHSYLKKLSICGIPGCPYSPVESSPNVGSTSDPNSLRQELIGYQVTFSQRTQDSTPTANNLNTILAGVVGLAGVMGGKAAFCRRLQGVEFRVRDIDMGGFGQAHGVSLNKNAFTIWTVVHELGHAWDGVNGWNLSKEMQNTVHAGYRQPWYWLPHIFCASDPRYWYYPGGSPPPCGIDQNFNAKEDFAETVTAYVFPDEASQKATARGWPYIDPSRGYSFANYFATPRGMFINNLLASG